MPLIECSSCKQELDTTRYSRCPNCGMDPKAKAPSLLAGPKTSATSSTATSTAVSPTTNPTTTKSTDRPPMTAAQADRIIALLESRTRKRVDVAARAEQASGVLTTLAWIAIALGGLGLIGTMATMFSGALWSGLLSAAAVIAFTALNWAVLTVASVVAGYVANRST